jgi:hypothetical protein
MRGAGPVASCVLLVLCATAGCRSRTTVERLTPDVLLVTGPASVVRLGDAPHPFARYRLRTQVDEPTRTLVNDVVVEVAYQTDEWMDADLAWLGEIEGRTVDVLMETDPVCDAGPESELLRELLQLLFPSPECRAAFVVPLPVGVLDAWSDGFTLHVETTSGKRWVLPVTAGQIAEHLSAVDERMGEAEANAESVDR